MPAAAPQMQQQLPACLPQYHASGLYQHGADDEGFFGFLLPDIEQTLQRVAEKVK